MQSSVLGLRGDCVCSEGKKQTAWRRRLREIVFLPYSRHFHSPPHQSSPSSVLLSPYICHHGGVEALWLGHRLAFLGLLARPPRSLLCGSSEGSSISLKGFSVLLTFGSFFSSRLLQTTVRARQRMHLLRLTFTGVRLRRNRSWFFVHPEGNQILFSSIENHISQKK